MRSLSSLSLNHQAQRAGTAYDAILSRALHREILNFGFAGNGHEDIGVAKYLVTLDAAVIVLDCLPNMGTATVGASSPATPCSVPLCAARTLNATGQAWFTLSPR